MKKENDFKYLLRHHDTDALNNHPGTIYAVWEDYTLAYMNKAWYEFSGKNQGQSTLKKWTLGSNFLDAISGNLKTFYEENFKACLSSPSGNWRHEYECSSAKLFRKFHMDVSVLGEREGLLIVHSLVIERPYPAANEADSILSPSDYLTMHNLIRQCSSCRCVERQKPSSSWDWVPQWITDIPKNTTHGLCPACIGRYFPVVA